MAADYVPLPSNEKTCFDVELHPALLPHVADLETHSIRGPPLA
jgi:hypothetical protein